LRRFITNAEKTTREKSINNYEKREDLHNVTDNDNESERERRIRREMFGYKKNTNIQKQIMKKKARRSVTVSGSMKRLFEGEILRGRRGDTLRVTETVIRATEGVHWYTRLMLKTAEMLRCTQQII